MKIEYEFMFPIKVRIEKLKLLIEALQKEQNLIRNSLKEMNDENRITINNIGALLDNYLLEKSRLEIAYEYYNNHLK